MAPDERSGTASRRPLDRVALARVVQRLHRAPGAPWLHGEVARRMAERLPVIRMQPQRVLDWWSSLGGSAAVLAKAYPRAEIIQVGPDVPGNDTPVVQPQAWWSPRRWTRARPELALAQGEVGAGAAQLLWANMVLHAAIDPQALMSEWHRALQADGFLMFSTLGPGCLPELRALYAQQRWPTPFAPFVDMHDLGDMLIEAGFADPVMDQEQVTLTWPTPQALLAELRQMGGNVDPERLPGLRTPRWRDRLLALLAAGADAGGRLPLRFEIVYGHAFRPAPRPRLAAQTELPLDDMRAMLRSGRGRAPMG